MKSFLHAARFLVLDMASTIFFLALYLTTHNIPLSVAIGMAMGVGQIVLQRVRKRPIDTMQWMSLFLVIASGTATFLTNDPRFVLVKPSVIYCIVGTVMLKPGWMNRYLPEIAMQVVPDIATKFGFVWSALMFVSAAVNLYVALSFDTLTWTGFMSAWSTGTKIALFLIQFATMRLIGARRRARAEAALAAPVAA